MDEDNEMVNMNSQSDLDEALNIEELHTLKLTAFKANTPASEARNQLLKDADEVSAMNESINLSGFYAGKIDEEDKPI